MWSRTRCSSCTAGIMLWGLSHACIIYKSWVLSMLSPLFLLFFFLQLAFAEGQSEGPKVGLDSKELLFLVQITCQVNSQPVGISCELFIYLFIYLLVILWSLWLSCPASGTKLAGEEVLRRLPGARQTPAPVYLWSAILGAERAAQIRHRTGHRGGTAAEIGHIYAFKKKLFCNQDEFLPIAMCLFFPFRSCDSRSVSDQDVGHLPVPLLLHRRQQDQLRSGSHMDGGISWFTGSSCSVC